MIKSLRKQKKYYLKTRNPVTSIKMKRWNTTTIFK